VPIISVPQPFNEDDLYVDLRSIFGRSLFLKCEGFNFAGSIKLKAAAEMVEAAERDGLLTPESVLVESSSGNLGVALSMLAASKGYRFLCVTDSRCNLATRLRMEALGSQVHIITEPDARAASSAPGSATSARCAPPTTGTCGSTSTPTRATGRRTTARRRRRSPASSRDWTCCSSGPAPPGP
jgi:cysteine synthase